MLDKSRKQHAYTDKNIFSFQRKLLLSIIVYYENRREYSLGIEFTHCQTDIKMLRATGGYICHNEVKGKIKTSVMTGKGTYFPDS